MKNGDYPINPTGHNQTGTGLTKREYFAGLALQGLLGNPALNNLNLNPKDNMKDTVMVEYSIRMADELLKQLDNQ